MKSTSARVTLAIVALGLAFAVSGCGGGGGDGTASMTGPEEPPAPAPRAVLEPGPGLHPSDAAPVVADMADKTVLAAQEDGDTIPTLSATIARDFDTRTSAVSTSGSSVKSIRGDGDGGFHITFVDGGVETPIHFSRGDFNASRSLFEKDEAGVEYLLWSYGGFSEDDLTAELPGYQYLASLGGTAGSGQAGFDRFYFVFGARSPASFTARGSASFDGRFRADTFDADDPGLDRRQRLSGHMRIVANFDLGKLEGNVRSIRGTEPGALYGTRTLWPTSSFRIADGKFNEAGQFTATLTGHDSAETPSLVLFLGLSDRGSAGLFRVMMVGISRIVGSLPAGGWGTGVSDGRRRVKPLRGSFASLRPFG